MDKGTKTLTELSMPTLPRDGIREVAQAWAGDGSLLAALSETSSQRSETAWTIPNIRRRARRVLLEMLEPELLALPSTNRQWAQYLPIMLTSETASHISPRGAINWPATVRRYGWLPTRYIARTRSRSLDEIPLAVLAWVSARLSDHLGDVSIISPALASRLRPCIATLHQVTVPISSQAVPRTPDRIDLLALARSGFPWRNIAAIADTLSRAETDLEFLAFELLEADLEVVPRLFHLSVFGSLIATLRSMGCRITWNFPLGMAGRGPHIHILTPTAMVWDLWFEAGKSRSHYDLSQSMYHSAVSGISGVGYPLRADVLLVDHPNRAMIFECKWSDNPSYVARDGYHQAASYALDTMNGLAGEVWSFIVGPHEVIPAISIATEAWDSMNLILGSMSVKTLPLAVGAFLTCNPSVIQERAVYS